MSINNEKLNSETIIQKRSRNRLSSSLRKAVKEKIIELYNEGHPIEVIAVMCKLSNAQATNLILELLSARRIEVQYPKYRILRKR